MDASSSGRAGAGGRDDRGGCRVIARERERERERERDREVWTTSSTSSQRDLQVLTRCMIPPPTWLPTTGSGALWARKPVSALRLCRETHSVPASVFIPVAMSRSTAGSMAKSHVLKSVTCECMSYRHRRRVRRQGGRPESSKESKGKGKGTMEVTRLRARLCVGKWPRGGGGGGGSLRQEVGEGMVLRMGKARGGVSEVNYQWRLAATCSRAC